MMSRRLRKTTQINPPLHVSRENRDPKGNLASSIAAGKGKEAEAEGPPPAPAPAMASPGGRNNRNTKFLLLVDPYSSITGTGTGTGTALPQPLLHLHVLQQHQNQKQQHQQKKQRRRTRLDQYRQLVLCSKTVTLTLKQQCLFVIPVVVMFVFLSQLNRWELLLRLQSKHQHKHHYKQLRYKRQHLQNLPPNSNNNSTNENEKENENWKLDFLKAKDATTLPFQFPTPFTVRDFYNHYHYYALNNLQIPANVMPEWLWHYVTFHNQHVYWNDQQQVWALQPGTKYLNYKWCHAIDHTKHNTWTMSRLWKLLVHNNNNNPNNKVLPTCHSEKDLIHALDGLLTALYVAMMTDRVLIVEDSLVTPLQGYLDPHWLQWNIQDYSSKQSSSLLSPVSLLFGAGVPIQDDTTTTAVMTLIPASTTSEIAFVQDLCLHYTSITGIELSFPATATTTTKTSSWLGETHLWNSQCLQDYWKKHGSHEPPLLLLSSSLDRRQLYKWGFWTLFRINETTLDVADYWRTLAGMPETVTVTLTSRSNSSSSGNSKSASGDSTKSKAPPQPQEHTAFQPYYYGLLDPTTTTTTIYNDTVVVSCAETLYKVSSNFANTILEEEYDDDDDAVDDTVKRKYYGPDNNNNPKNGQILKRSLLLAVASPAAKTHQHKKPKTPSSIRQKETGGVTDDDASPILPIRTLPSLQWPIPSSSQQQQQQQQQQLRSTTGRSSSSQEQSWYTQSNVWAELVIAVEAECLILTNKNHNNIARHHGHNDGFSSGEKDEMMNRWKLSAILAPRVSLTHPYTLKRCIIASAQECDDHDHHDHDHKDAAMHRLSKMLRDTLPWINEALENVEGSEEKEDDESQQ